MIPLFAFEAISGQATHGRRRPALYLDSLLAGAQMPGAVLRQPVAVPQPFEVAR